MTTRETSQHQRPGVYPPGVCPPGKFPAHGMSPAMIRRITRRKASDSISRGNKIVRHAYPGDRYGKLTVMGPASPEFYGKNTVRRVECACQCGRRKVVRVGNLVKGFTKTCGYQPCRPNGIKER